MTPRPRLTREAPYPWFHFVAKSSEAAGRWVAAYRQGDSLKISTAVDRALTLCRQRRLEEAHALLEAVRDRLDQPEGDWDRPTHHVLTRWYLGALAYYLYMQKDLDAAEEASTQAHREVEQALDLAPFLLPLAHHCHEFRLQRARIARKRHRWRELREHLTVVEQMVTDQRPLASPPGLGRVYEADVFAFLDTLPLEDEEARYVDRFRDPAHRRALVIQFAGMLYPPPGFVIRFP